MPLEKIYIAITFEQLKTLSSCLNNERLLLEDIKKEYKELYDSICDCEKAINKEYVKWYRYFEKENMKYEEEE